MRYKDDFSKENLVSAVAGAISILSAHGSLRFDLKCLNKTMTVPERKLTMQSLSKMIVGALFEAPNRTLEQKVLPQMLGLESTSEKRRIYVSDRIPLYAKRGLHPNLSCIFFPFQDVMSVLEGIGLIVRYKDKTTKDTLVSVAEAMSTSSTNSVTEGCASTPLDLSFPLGEEPGCKFEVSGFVLDFDAQVLMEEEDALLLALAGCEGHFSSSTSQSFWCWYDLMI